MDLLHFLVETFLFLPVFLRQRPDAGDQDDDDDAESVRRAQRDGGNVSSVVRFVALVAGEGDADMVVMTDRQASVAANTTVANVLSGKVHEFLGRPSLVRVYQTAQAVGINTTVLVGGVSVVQDQEINAQNRMPIVPDDFVAEAGGIAGDRIVVSVRNTTGGAITGVFTRVEVIPVR